MIHNDDVALHLLSTPTGVIVLGSMVLFHFCTQGIEYYWPNLGQNLSYICGYIQGFIIQHQFKGGCPVLFFIVIPTTLVLQFNDLMGHSPKSGIF